MAKRLQCKDIPDRPILELLDSLNKDGDRAGYVYTRLCGDNRDDNVASAMPEGVPRNLILAKMGQLIRRGLVDGCNCGCCGAFNLTKKGKEFLEGK